MRVLDYRKTKRGIFAFDHDLGNLVLMISVRISASPMIVLSETYTEYSNSVAGRSRRGGISNQLHNIQKADCEGFLSQRCYDVLGIRDGTGPFLKYA